MEENIKPVIKKVISQNIPDENVARQKMYAALNEEKFT